MAKLSRQPRSRLGVWLFISLAAHISCLPPSHGGREGEQGNMGLGLERSERTSESIQNHSPGANLTREIRAPSPRQKPVSASLPGVLFLHPAQLAQKGKMSPGTQTAVLMHTAGSLTTKHTPIDLLLP